MIIKVLIFNQYFENSSLIRSFATRKEVKKIGDMVSPILLVF